MSGEDNNTINTPMMEQLMTMLNNRFNSIEENNNNMNINTNNNINSLKTDMNNINEKVGSLQEVNLAIREELLARIDTKSRFFSRASSRATSPKQLMKQLHEKLPVDKLPLETPRGQYPDVQVSMTEIFRDAKAADDFAEKNKG